MRDYSKVSPRFWTGETGRAIRKMGPEVQVVAFYLFTCPSANMLGLYYLAMPTLVHETGRPLQGASKALRSLREANFAYYDEVTEHVWVPNMAREQIGVRLSAKDNRHIAVLRELEQLRKTPFFNDFVTLYRDAYHLHDVALNTESASKNGSPFEAPSKPLRSQAHEQEQEQAQKSLLGGETHLADHPPGLDVAAWDMWVAYRKEKKDPLKPASYRMAMKKMAALGADQMEAVENSIANGYTGLFAPRSGPNKPVTKREPGSDLPTLIA